MKSIFFILLGLVLVACKKFLDKKPDEKLATPSTVQDLQYLLDNYGVLNTRFATATETLSDNYYLSVADWSSLDELQRNLYLWRADDNTNGMYTSLYTGVYYANVVLESAGKMKNALSGEEAMNNIRGSALFFRAAFFWEAAQLFSKPFSSGTAATDPGIPLRLGADYSVRSVRASTEETYRQILTDYKEAADLLPLRPLLKTRPSRPAAYGALARTYLSMRQYDSAGYYAAQCLHLYDSLLDYNTLNAAAAFPVIRFNREVIFHSKTAQGAPLLQARYKVDSVLYSSYGNNDLRRTTFYRTNGNGSFAFKGDYDGSAGSLFTGITVAEMYLIRAECYARNNQTTPALQDINMLLQRRWKAGNFIPLTAGNSGEALGKILAERRKELVMRGLRWSDLRRFSQEPPWTVLPKRIMNTQIYELAPTSERYVLKLPRQVIEQTGILQNP